LPPIVDRKVMLSDWLGGENDYPPFSGRDEIMVVAGEEMRTGTILQGSGVDGEYEAWAPGGDPVGFLITDYIPGDTSAPVRAVGLFRGPAHIKEMGVPWPEGISAGEIDAVKAAFAEKLIVFRQCA